MAKIYPGVCPCKDCKERSIGVTQSARSISVGRRLVLRLSMPHRATNGETALCGYREEDEDGNEV